MFIFKYLAIFIFFFSADALAYKFAGASWSLESGAVPFALHPNGSDDIDSDEDLDAVGRAFYSWSCVAGSGLRFYEMTQAGPAELNLEDGINTVFWAETKSLARESGLGPGTLGITLADVPNGSGETITRKSADIVFNGYDHVWSVGGSETDVESIAVHEVGHFVGFDHPCVDEAETDCLSIHESALSPFYTGGEFHDLGPDDESGMLEIYPSNDDSSCAGPFGLYEICEDDCSCVEGLFCGVQEDTTRCSLPCSNQNTTCPSSFTCELTVPDATTGTTRGVCKKDIKDKYLGPGRICEVSGQCASADCGLILGLNRQVCLKSCSYQEDCGSENFCYEGYCLPQNKPKGIDCDTIKSPNGCHCEHSQENGFYAMVGLLILMRTRRSFLRS